METRVLKVLTEDDIKKIQDTVSSWRSRVGYEDIEGFCKSSTTEEIEKNGFVLTPGRYVGFAEGENDSVSFDEKIKVLINDLKKIQSESKDIEIDINKNLRKFFNK